MGAYFLFVFFVFLQSFPSFPVVYLCYSGAHAEKSSVQYLLTIEQLVENDHPILRTLRTHFKSQTGGYKFQLYRIISHGRWIYYEMVHFLLFPIHQNDDPLPVHDNGRKGANLGLHHQSSTWELLS